MYINTDGLFGAAHTPTDGHVDPSSTTYAQAKAARNLGAAVEVQCPVQAISREHGSWLVQTENGPVRAKHIVMAASFWTRELLLPLGLNVPL